MDHYYTYASVDLALRGLMEKEFNLPTLVENDATSACFGEHWLDLKENYKNVLYMFSGVGCGMIINGELYRGAQGYAGEVAVYNYKEQDLFSCEAAGSCFVKRWDLDLGVVEDVKKTLLKEKQSAEEFFRISSANIEDLDLKSIFNAARLKNPVALNSLAKAAKRLGIKVAYLVNLLNPQIVVIGGGFEDAGEEFLNTVRSTVMDWAFREATSNLKIVYSQLRENAVAMGASSLVLEKVFAQL
jgi:predicted NBD/HSP70 family sugar kinase